MSCSSQISTSLAVGKSRFHIKQGDIDAVVLEYKKTGVHCQDGPQLLSAVKRHMRRLKGHPNCRAVVNIPSSIAAQALRAIANCTTSELRPTQTWVSDITATNAVCNRRLVCAFSAAAAVVYDKDGATAAAVNHALDGVAEVEADGSPGCSFSVVCSESLDPRCPTVIKICGSHSPSCHRRRHQMALHPKLEARAAELVGQQVDPHTVLQACVSYVGEVQMEYERGLCEFLGIEVPVSLSGADPAHVSKSDSSISSPALRIRSRGASLRPVVAAVRDAGLRRKSINAPSKPFVVDLTLESPQRELLGVASMAGAAPPFLSRGSKRKRHHSAPASQVAENLERRSRTSSSRSTDSSSSDSASRSTSNSSSGSGVSSGDGSGSSSCVSSSSDEDTSEGSDGGSDDSNCSIGHDACGSVGDEAAGPRMPDRAEGEIGLLESVVSVVF